MIITTIQKTVNISEDGNILTVSSQGVQGLSAYQIAVSNGFIGTEVEWLATFGAGGSGTIGADGMSAYEVSIANGYVGTEAQWLLSLVGEQGVQGLQGIQGAQGIQGIQGATGATGQGLTVGGTAGQILSKIDSIDFNTEWTTPPDTSNMTAQGNTFNGASQLVQLDATGKLPAVDGSLLTGISGVSDGVQKAVHYKSSIIYWSEFKINSSVPFATTCVGAHFIIYKDTTIKGLAIHVSTIGDGTNKTKLALHSANANGGVGTQIKATAELSITEAGNLIGLFDVPVAVTAGLYYLVQMSLNTQGAGHKMENGATTNYYSLLGFMVGEDTVANGSGGFPRNNFTYATGIPIEPSMAIAGFAYPAMGVIIA